MLKLVLTKDISSPNFHKRYSLQIKAFGFGFYEITINKNHRQLKKILKIGESGKAFWSGKLSYLLMIYLMVSFDFN